MPICQQIRVVDVFRALVATSAGDVRKHANLGAQTWRENRTYWSSASQPFSTPYLVVEGPSDASDACNALVIGNVEAVPRWAKALSDAIENETGRGAVMGSKDGICQARAACSCPRAWL